MLPYTLPYNMFLKVIMKLVCLFVNTEKLGRASDENSRTKVIFIALNWYLFFKKILVQGQIGRAVYYNTQV